MKNTIIISFALLAAACGGRSGKPAQTAGQPTQQEKETIKMPLLPSYLATDEDKEEYLALHFWDNYDFSDTSYLDLPQVTEQYFADYIHMLNNMHPEIGVKSIKAMLGKAQETPAVYDYFVELYDKYLYDPNSPMRNETLYIPVLEHIIASDEVDPLEKIRPEYRLKMALKNRPGEKANDINITLASGKTTRLYDVKADFTLLFINNPDCHACAEVTAGIQSSDIVMPLINKGAIKVVMVYPDEDLDAWFRHQQDVPSDWINGYDKNFEMRDKELYDLKAIPTLYLLDRSKNVLVKDAADVRMIEYYLHSSGF